MYVIYSVQTSAACSVLPGNVATMVQYPDLYLMYNAAQNLLQDSNIQAHQHVSFNY